MTRLALALAALTAACTGSPRDATTDAGGTADAALPPDAALAGRDPFPPGSIAFYLATSCPSDWAKYTDATGRAVVPAPTPDDVAVTAGEPLGVSEVRTHRHDVGVAVDLGSTSFVGVAGGGNGGVANAQLVEGTIATADVGAELPYVQLLVCRKTGDANAEVVPSGLIAYFEDGACPTGWGLTGGIAGRMLVALPEDGTPGATFGGEPLTSGERRTHTHSVAATMDTDSHGIALASGCCAGGYATDDAYPIASTSAASESGLPYVQLLACAKQ